MSRLWLWMSKENMNGDVSDKNTQKKNRNNNFGAVAMLISPEPSQVHSGSSS